VLVVAVELPSLNLQLDDLSRDNLVSSALFGDGAAAVVMRGRRPRGVRVLDTTSHLFPESTHALALTCAATGFHCVLSKDIPGMLRRPDRRRGGRVDRPQRAGARAADLFRRPPGRQDHPGSFEEAWAAPHRHPAVVGCPA